MYYIKKRLEISGAHKLKLPYESKCENLHGHNWIITIYLKADSLNDTGMIVDFHTVENTVMKKMDHQNLNDVFDFNPTAENIAAWICEQFEECYQVDVQESESGIATYIKNGEIGECRNEICRSI